MLTRTPFGDYLAAERARRDLSCSAFARLIGVSSATPTTWERHGRQPQMHHVAATAAAFEADVEELLRLAGYTGGKAALDEYMLRTRRAFPDLYPAPARPGSKRGRRTAFGQWLQAACKRTDTTGPTLAATLGVKSHTVKRWKQDTTPEIPHVVALARHFDDDVERVLAVAGYTMEQYKDYAAGVRRQPTRIRAARIRDADDTELAALTREGRADAFAELARRYRAQLVAVEHYMRTEYRTSVRVAHDAARLALYKRAIRASGDRHRSGVFEADALLAIVRRRLASAVGRPFYTAAQLDALDFPAPDDAPLYPNGPTVAELARAGAPFLVALATLAEEPPAARADRAAAYWREGNATVHDAAVRFGAPVDMVWRRTRDHADTPARSDARLSAAHVALWRELHRRGTPQTVADLVGVAVPAWGRPGTMRLTVPRSIRRYLATLVRFGAATVEGTRTKHYSSARAPPASSAGTRGGG